MSLFDFFFPKRPATASIAKERLQIVLAHERAGRESPDFLPRLQRELLAVVTKYVAVHEDMIRVNLGKAGSASVLEINVEMPVAAGSKAKAKPVPA
ncbi:MAG TPA: cell division topological specificity factor MinE [Stellaceae bacterium]|nr:cell division topological specificity factor MinE [Stellaceae bacterium]